MAMSFGLASLLGQIKSLGAFGVKQFAFEKIFDKVSDEVVDKVSQQGPKWGGLTKDDEAVLQRIDTSLEYHYPKSLPHIAKVRERLNQTDVSGKLNRNWRLTIVSLEVIEGVKERKLKSHKSTTDSGEVKKPTSKTDDRITTTSTSKNVVEELFEDVETFPAILPKEDVRVQHLHQIAQIAKGTDGISKAVSHLRASYLNDDSFLSNMKTIFTEVAAYVLEGGQYAFQRLGTGLGKTIAHVIIGHQYFTAIDNRRISDPRKMVMLAHAVSAEMRVVQAQLDNLRNESFLTTLRRRKFWIILLGSLVAAPIIIHLAN